MRIFLFFLILFTIFATEASGRDLETVVSELYDETAGLKLTRDSLHLAGSHFFLDGREFTATSGATAMELTPLTKSLLVPGWGQFSLERNIRGAVFMSVAVTSISLAVYYNRRGSETYDRYRDSTDPATILIYRHETQTWDERRNQAIGLAVINHLASILDILLFAGDKEQHRSWFAVTAPPACEAVDQETAGVCLSWCFAL